MSNVQRGAGSLFARMRDMQARLDAGNRDVMHVIALVDRVAADLESVTRKLDEQRRRTRMWFALVVGINGGIYLTLLHMRMYGLYVAYKHEKTVRERSIVGEFVDEWLMWLFVRPWFE
jgi:hypothetical protein